MDDTKNDRAYEVGEAYPILDSMLITATISSKLSKLNQDIIEHYNVKIVECGSFIQMYIYSKSKKKLKEKDTSDLNLKKIKLNGCSKTSIDVIDSKNDTSQIEGRNIIRSKLECQRIAKANMNEWKTFITLTFKENLTNIPIANKHFHNYIRKVQRIYKDFKYLAVIEFQERGSIHYHLFTNLPVDSELVPKREVKKLYNQKTKTYKEIEYYDLKYWNNGFSQAEPINIDETQKVVGYISKYMTKNVDNRLFGHRRYLYSLNIEKPKESFVDLNNDVHKDFLNKKIQDCDLIYQNQYKNIYDDSDVTFIEFLKK